MKNCDSHEKYCLEKFKITATGFLPPTRKAMSLEDARKSIYAMVSGEQLERSLEERTDENADIHVSRDCARAFRGMLSGRADKHAGFSVTQALWDISTGKSRPDLSPGFFAEMEHLVNGLEGRAERFSEKAKSDMEILSGRPAAIRRSVMLDAMWESVENVMSRYEDGLSDQAVKRRGDRRKAVLDSLGAKSGDFDDWRWQVRNIARDERLLSRMARLTDRESEAIRRARHAKLPFGVTPYYASLFDDDPETGRDRALRAQVIPPDDYTRAMGKNRADRESAFDFMLEKDTSPVDLVTRRYPAIAILKPYNTCPQICVYCQRNWEIDEAMAPGALASEKDIDSAIDFIRARPAIKEVLVTGGDPLGLSDGVLMGILQKVASIDHVDMIRIGTRIPVTLPMRITPELASSLGSLRRPGYRDICVVTHVEHPYEITPELVRAVNLLKQEGISVYNQLVFTFFVSRRFEAARLRMLLKRCGVDPYYTFMPKGKEETGAYRVPLARLLQEQKEEARLLPGTRRMDEPVYNVPGLGKNYLRAFQHRDIISVLPDGARVYDFHSWEKGIGPSASYVGTDVPILDYLSRLRDMGENPDDYESIWYYY